SVERVLVLVQMANEVDDPALVLKCLALPGAALVDQVDAQVAGQERGLPKPLAERLVVVDDLLEDLVVGQERDRGPGPRRLLAPRQVPAWCPPLVLLGPYVAIAAHLQVQPL